MRSLLQQRSDVLDGHRYGIKDENIPHWEDIKAQMLVSIQAIPMYTMLPPLAEWFIRKGYTLCYAQVDTVGWPMYAVYFVMYMASVEVCAGPPPSLRFGSREPLVGTTLLTPGCGALNDMPALVMRIPMPLPIVSAYASKSISSWGSAGATDALRSPLCGVVRRVLDAPQAARGAPRVQVPARHAPRVQQGELALSVCRAGVQPSGRCAAPGLARRHASRCVTLIGLCLTSHLGLAPPSSLR